MIDKWLETDKNANWSQLIKALNTESVSLNTLANEIKKITKGTDLICSWHLCNIISAGTNVKDSSICLLSTFSANVLFYQTVVLIVKM